MSDSPDRPQKPLYKGRCPQDDVKDFRAEVQLGDHKFVAEGPEIAGINAVMSAITTLGALMNQGVPIDYVERVAIGVMSKIITTEDKHVLCPLHIVVTMVSMVMTGEAAVAYDPKTDVFRVVSMFAAQLSQILGPTRKPEEQAGPPPPPTKDDGGGIFGDMT